MEENYPTQSSGEPLSPVAVITGLVSAGITLLVSFGLHLTADQIAAITSFVALAAPVVVWLIGRRSVTPTKNVVAVKNVSGQVVAGDAAAQISGSPVTVAPRF